MNQLISREIKETLWVKHKLWCVWMHQMMFSFSLKILYNSGLWFKHSICSTWSSLQFCLLAEPRCKDLKIKTTYMTPLGIYQRKVLKGILQLSKNASPVALHFQENYQLKQSNELPKPDDQTKLNFKNYLMSEWPQNPSSAKRKAEVPPDISRNCLFMHAEHVWWWCWTVHL